ncbi:MAG: radical SAM protein [Deltaproteobacteria bacterium]|nr:radical SAM protein [Deltaproteobacteria bacterium]
MKVLLISANTERITMTVPPVGLASVAAATQAAGHEVIMVDLMATEEGAQTAVAAAIDPFDADVIGISVRNIDDQRMESPKFLLAPVREIVAECRRLTRAPTVLGGAGFSIFPASVLAYLDADMGIRGEGEEAFPALLSIIRNGQDPSGVPGLYLPGAGTKAKRSFIRDLDSLPVPNRHLHLLQPADRDLWIQIQTRRGCPMGCSYCSTAAIEGRSIRKRSPESVVRQISETVQAGFHRFYFVDNTFNLPPSYAKELCRKIIASGHRIAWLCIVYPRYVDAELADLMARAGCRHISLGFESGSPPILKNMNKRFTPEDVRRIAALFAATGIKQQGFLMLGGPVETRETVEQSIDFADSLPIDGLKVTTGIRIYPETTLSEIARADGTIAPDDDLLHPRFYMAHALRDWLPERIAQWTSARPQWIS